MNSEFVARLAAEFPSYTGSSFRIESNKGYRDIRSTLALKIQYGPSDFAVFACLLFGNPDLLRILYKLADYVLEYLSWIPCKSRSCRFQSRSKAYIALYPVVTGAVPQA
jgi:hypothetical protein